MAAGKRLAKKLFKRCKDWSDAPPHVYKAEDGSVHVAWEEGPPNWAMNDPYYAHEEMAAEFGMEFGGDLSYNADDYEPYYDDIPGVWIEPYNSFTVSITKD